MMRLHYLHLGKARSKETTLYTDAPAYSLCISYRDGEAAAAAEMGKSWHTGAAPPAPPAVGAAPLVRT